MFVLVVGGGKVGYYLAKELIDSGHEVALMEKDSTRARQITDEIGSIVIPHDGCEGKYLGEAGSNRADIVAAVTGDDTIDFGDGYGAIDVLTSDGAWWWGPK